MLCSEKKKTVGKETSGQHIHLRRPRLFLGSKRRNNLSLLNEDKLCNLEEREEL